MHLSFNTQFNLSCSSRTDSEKYRPSNVCIISRFLSAIPGFTTNIRLQSGAVRGTFFFPAWWRPTYSYAAKAAEFGAVWAETSIPQFLHADEAAKHLSDALHRDRREMTWILTLQPQESSSLAYSVYSDQLTMMSLLDYKDISYSHYAHFTLKQLDIVCSQATCLITGLSVLYPLWIANGC